MTTTPNLLYLEAHLILRVFIGYLSLLYSLFTRARPQVLAYYIVHTTEGRTAATRRREGLKTRIRDVSIPLFFSVPMFTLRDGHVACFLGPCGTGLHARHAIR